VAQLEAASAIKSCRGSIVAEILSSRSRVMAP
jgi:hypothetical protein